MADSDFTSKNDDNRRPPAMLRSVAHVRFDFSGRTCGRSQETGGHPDGVPSPVRRLAAITMRDNRLGENDRWRPVAGNRREFRSGCRLRGPGPG